MHIQYTDLPEPKSLPEGATLEYATQDQDCRSLERFAIRTLNAGMHTPELIDESRESFWIIISGEGTMTRGDETTQIDRETCSSRRREFPIRSLLEIHLSNGFDVAFHSATWEITADALDDGIGDPHGDHVKGKPSLVRGEELPPQEGDSCYRYPHARPHSTLDHWDQNSSEPGARAANHVHDSHEEFWYITKVQGMSNKTGRSLRFQRAISSDMRRVSIIRLSLRRNRSVGTVSV